MWLIVDAIVATFGMLGIIISAFIAVLLLSLLLSPIENKLSEMVWRHSSHEMKSAVQKSSFKDFSRRHR